MDKWWHILMTTHSNLLFFLLISIGTYLLSTHNEVSMRIVWVRSAVESLLINKSFTPENVYTIKYESWFRFQHF